MQVSYNSELQPNFSRSTPRSFANIQAIVYSKFIDPRIKNRLKKFYTMAYESGLDFYNDKYGAQATVDIMPRMGFHSSRLSSVFSRLHNTSTRRSSISSVGMSSPGTTTPRVIPSPRSNFSMWSLESANRMPFRGHDLSDPQVQQESSR